MAYRNDTKTLSKEKTKFLWIASSYSYMLKTIWGEGGVGGEGV